MKSMPLSERPREKIFKYGSEALSTAELLSIIIKTGTKEKSALSLANAVLSCVENGVEDFSDLSIEELMEIKGIGIAKATQILAAIELGRRANTAKAEKFKITHPSDISDYFINKMSHFKREHFNIVLLDNKNFILETYNVSIGSLNSAIVHPREVYKQAIRRSAASIILVHNHPSGDISPSKEDILITRRLVDCGKLLGIRVLDHIIIGKDDYYSFKQNNKLE